MQSTLNGVKEMLLCINYETYNETDDLFPDPVNELSEESIWFVTPAEARDELCGYSSASKTEYISTENK